jgi:hypothetical protein
MTSRLPLLCLFAVLLAGCGEEPDIEELSVTPSPIAAPTDTAPTAFRIAVRSTDAEDLSCTVALFESDNGHVSTWPIIDFIPGSACVAGHVVQCRSSLSAADANQREIECFGAAHPDEVVFRATRPAGSQLLFRAYAVFQKASIPKSVGWALTHPGRSGSGDPLREITVELR